MVRWGRRAARGAGKQAIEVVRRASSVADLEQGAGHGPHHVAQEPVSAQLELDNPFVLSQLQPDVGARPNTRDRRRVMVRMVLVTGLPVDWNAAKSWVPSSGAAAAAIATEVERRR